MDTKTGRVAANGGKLAYSDEGSGPLVVLSPGMGDLRSPTASRFPPWSKRATGRSPSICAATATATPPSPPTGTSRPARTWST